MKKTVILTLLCINAVLLVALIMNSTEETALAQVRRSDYLVVTAKVQTDWEAIYVLDLASRRMAAFATDRTKQRIRPFGGGRELVRDFARRGGR